LINRPQVPRPPFKVPKRQSIPPKVDLAALCMHSLQ